MQIASVIVDVPTMRTDKTYDYLIPEEWKDRIYAGTRVSVPFGPRSIQGFVLDIRDHSDINKLKEIIEPLDLTPVLNKELLQLGHWLTESTLCLKVSAYQAMLPSAMKAKYKKILHLVSNTHDPNLQKIFGQKDEIMWEEAEERKALPFLQKEVKKGNVEVRYVVKSKGNKKMIRIFHLLLSREELENILLSYPNNAIKQKSILECFIKIGKDKLTINEITEATGATLASVRPLVQKGYLMEKQEEVYRDPYENRVFKRTEALKLTEEQQKAIDPIMHTIEEKKHETFLLYGVTGSGKTEVYLQSIQRVLDNGKEAIVLVPEISLTPQMVHRFKGRFGDDVAVLHSGLSVGEHYDEWRKIQRKEVKVVVGARSAIFAPFENLGIIIIDEEHETSYKQEENPRYHARDVAIFRGNYHKCPVILGSATPSLESFARAQKGVYTLLTMNRRMNNKELPNVSIVDMREELREGNRSIFSRELFSKLQDRLEKKQQTVLFLNKRGYSSFVMCRDCGFVIQCPHCDISLTYHRHSNQMKCHYCGYEDLVPTTCPECNSEHIRYFGTGTQKVEEEIGKLLPEARVIRMDVDTTSRKGAHEKLLQQFQEGKADILLGTQMIAKGLDFPNITLVGVLSADTMLHLPDFRSSEKTFQLLTQVSGRAGRHELEGEVVIQTYTPEHYSIELAGTQDYNRFYKQEMIMRKIGSYPPFYYLALITVSHEELMKVVSTTEKITKFIRSKISEDSVILGPVTSPIPRINNRYRYQCLIKYKREPDLAKNLRLVLEHFGTSKQSEGLTISIDVNPYMMM
ncbi:primosomal protein N' [Heyndrickxia shackletonii]|uniref:Replication restart protein PriA n=1 Tax=Heyndrickxia shackletonii TaxID=157838 RepID=A0A0Q3WZN4_9BACI|nr:primosomal protein N' [Heyndrickxia shackletonii]KQL54683.1 primosomal protein N' [Heyndrickxia shackletonii]NEY98333.1 primosomal protein N' [Heyndrickxia shackletonii]